MKKRQVHLSTLTLVTIGMFDLVTTLMLMSRGVVAEGNPLFARLAEHGSLPMAIGKLIFLAGPVLVLEYARLKKPRTAETATWLAAVLYFLLYASQLLRLRHMVGQ